MNSLFTVEMGWYRLQEYQCIMSKVSQYSDASLLKSIRSLNIMYDHEVTENDKIISLRIDPKLLLYCTRVFLLQKCHFKAFIIYRKYFIDQYTAIHWYINTSILNLPYWYTHWNSMHHNASVHHSIVPSLFYSHLKQLYIGNKTECFSYKGGCGIYGCTHIEM